MRGCFRDLLKLGFVISAMIAIIVWLVVCTEKTQNAGGWALAAAFTVPPFVFIWLRFHGSFRKEILFDLLLQKTGKYFEYEGLCFNFFPVEFNGVCFMQIYFQNRFEKPCHARVVLQASKTFWLRRPLPTIDVQFDCAGAAFGVCKFQWPIPLDLQGKRLQFDVAADATYPDGRGRLMRFREGIEVTCPGGKLLNAVTTGGLLLVGVISISRPARTAFQLPSGVAETVTKEPEIHFEILAQPDLHEVKT